MHTNQPHWRCISKTKKRPSNFNKNSAYLWTKEKTKVITVSYDYQDCLNISLKDSNLELGTFISISDSSDTFKTFLHLIFKL